MTEPGPTAPNGRPSSFCNIDSDSFQNVLIGHGNTGHIYVNDSESSLVITHAQLKHNEADFDRVEARDATIGTFKSETKVDAPSEYFDVFRKLFEPSNPPSFHDVFRFYSDAPNQVFMMDLTITSANAASSNHSSAKYVVSGKSSSANTVSASIDFIGGESSIECQVLTEDSFVTVRVMPSYYLHSNFLVMLRVKSVGNMRIELIDSAE